ncbi:dynein light chain 4, axonemal isoform X1 [Neophocaena asiaeorientalis asiaeorientalis]|uniref:Dynein light chain n=2 Tax=Odontoceti TaxID=9722 RepID=A0A341CRN0_NEOAA|nr:dynein light chain 4, axonemal isoform X1 [Delphinapterus leucas]XP_024617410.1 dynein light chain 4, axonemal isoform X1 [Neophocaena asiaeorientalis asiaeorientalis]XP_024617411.1 dynein light chain 4, axonemal isoform X1 [Neophocaena asiaeorientalis asiaeorientalis]XP_024617412.1 dynein light chain 4, axonemal isoform X1 [Neophocaena asiaeorientalis asiaeorientalis]XP_029060058.1 dynein light chain 4, axonemal isoform X1 [Monodon monoceros]XP_029060059.1 dynein light chain 4, axonemal is
MGETEGKKDEADYKRLQTFPLVRHSDMPEEMRVETMELCVTACEKFSNNNESAAKMIKETMDKKFGSSWHVVIGEGFGFEITHEAFSCCSSGMGSSPRQLLTFQRKAGSLLLSWVPFPEPRPVCEFVDISAPGSQPSHAESQGVRGRQGRGGEM